MRYLTLALLANASKCVRIGRGRASASPVHDSLRCDMQILVVATDVPSVAYICPTTYVMLCAYICQLLIAVGSVLIYLLW